MQRGADIDAACLRSSSARRKQATRAALLQAVRRASPQLQALKVGVTRAFQLCVCFKISCRWLFLEQKKLRPWPLNWKSERVSAAHGARALGAAFNAKFCQQH